MKPESWKEVLSNKFIYELSTMGIKEEWEIDAYVQEQLLIKGMEL